MTSNTDSIQQAGGSVRSCAVCMFMLEHKELKSLRLQAEGAERYHSNLPQSSSQCVHAALHISCYCLSVYLSKKRSEQPVASLPESHWAGLD